MFEHLKQLLVRIHFITVMIRWTGLAPWEFEFPSPGSLTSTFLTLVVNLQVPEPAGDVRAPQEALLRAGPLHQDHGCIPPLLFITLKHRVE